MTSLQKPESKTETSVVTVLGPIDPKKVGITLTHEHFLIDFMTVLTVPDGAGERKYMHEPLSMDNLWWVRYNWTSNMDNLQLFDEQLAIEEASHYFNNGGSTIVDVTSVGIGRDPEALVRISRSTGLNIVMGSGYYVDSTHSDKLRRMPVSKIADQIILDVKKGVGVNNVRAGLIGEIGCSWPWTESEKKVLEAAVAAQKATGAPLLIHPGRNQIAPIEILNSVSKLGGDITRTVMGHIERTIYDRNLLKDVLDTGAYVNLDLFGHDESHYPLDTSSNMPADHERIAQIEFMIDEGGSNQILMSHDVCSKHRLKKYGGHGYDHIITRIVPRMLAKGISQEDISKILIDNPTTMLTFKRNV